MVNSRRLSTVSGFLIAMDLIEKNSRLAHRITLLIFIGYCFLHLLNCSLHPHKICIANFALWLKFGRGNCFLPTSHRSEIVVWRLWRQLLMTIWTVSAGREFYRCSNFFSNFTFTSIKKFCISYIFCLI